MTPMMGHTLYSSRAQFIFFLRRLKEMVGGFPLSLSRLLCPSLARLSCWVPHTQFYSKGFAAAPLPLVAGLRGELTCSTNVISSSPAVADSMRDLGRGGVAPALPSALTPLACAGACACGGGGGAHMAAAAPLGPCHAAMGCAVPSKLWAGGAWRGDRAEPGVAGEVLGCCMCDEEEAVVDVEAVEATVGAALPSLTLLLLLLLLLLLVLVVIEAVLPAAVGAVVSALASLRLRLRGRSAADALLALEAATLPTPGTSAAPVVDAAAAVAAPAAAAVVPLLLSGAGRFLRTHLCFIMAGVLTLRRPRHTLGGGSWPRSRLIKARRRASRSSLPLRSCFSMASRPDAVVMRRRYTCLPIAMRLWWRA